VKSKLGIALAGCAALTVTLSGCGNDDNSEETEAWARQVCDQLQPQVEKIQDASAAITEASEGDKSPEQVQEADSAAFGDISDAYAALASTVQDAGEPPVEEGARLRREAVNELTDISDSYGELQDTIDGLDTSDRSEFADGLTGIADRLAELGESGDEALSELQSGDLGEAMAEQPDCQSPSPGQGDGNDGGDQTEGPDSEDGSREESPDSE
jgi:hypothetical protein